jgi:hypothetical protein
MMKLVLHVNPLLGKNVEKGLAMGHRLDDFLVVVCNICSDDDLAFFYVDVNLSVNIIDYFLGQFDVLLKVMDLCLKNFNCFIGALYEVMEAFVLGENVPEHQLDSSLPHASAFAQFLSEPGKTFWVQMVNDMVEIT